MARPGYTKEQKQECANLCHIKLSTVSSYVSRYSLDASNPLIFQQQYDLLLKKQVKITDEETEAAKKQRIVAQAKKEEVMLEKAELDLAVSKGELISIESQVQLFSHIGLLVKTHIEALGGSVSVMCEGKSAKEIKKVIDAKGAEILHQLSNIK